MPRTVDPRRLQKKTSQTMLAAQRRGAMEGNRLCQRLAQLKANNDWDMRTWGRQYRQAEQQLSLANLVLSDHVIDVNTISEGRAEAPSSADRRRQLAQIHDHRHGGGGVSNGEEVPRARRQRRRPESVFKAQLERQHELAAERERSEAAETTKQAIAEGSASESQPPPTPGPQPQVQPVRCQFAGSGGAPCNRFPCCLPQTYSFLSNKREMLKLYDLLLTHLPPHKRPQSAATSEAGSDLSSMIADAEFLVSAQRHVSTLDPVERARVLRQAVDDWKRRHSRQQPEPRETRYGKPYPMRRILKPISCSSSFFL